MFDKIFHALHDEIAYEHMSIIMDLLKEVLEAVGQDYLKDKDKKNAVIDALCEVLQHHKDKE